VDCTLGGAGHSRLIAEHLSASGTLIGIDQDEVALNAARQRLADVNCHVHIRKANFRQLPALLRALGLTQVDGLLFDLGVSSPQLDQIERGFSYHHDAPLDMRMDRSNPLTAAEIVNSWSEEQLSRTLFTYGEERFARRIAQRIVQARAEKPIQTTLELVELIKQAIPERARRKGRHPARRTFQAIRIAVNDELHVFEQTLKEAISLLKHQGRICVITFHSLEDRICKQIFQESAKGCICPPNFPVCTCGRKPIIRRVNRKPILPSAEEIAQNPRARSAKLRIAEKIEKGSM
jgi:16S rRNA (cytosine1402-N4)-methyltransferase